MTTATSRTVDCCIVGGGPAGMVLGLLLARQGVEVCVLEAHADFNRDFRGDTVHPSTLEMLDQIGLLDSVLAVSPERITDFPLHFPDGTISSPAPWRLHVKHLSRCRSHSRSSSTASPNTRHSTQAFS